MLIRLAMWTSPTPKEPLGWMSMRSRQRPSIRTRRSRSTLSLSDDEAYRRSLGPRAHTPSASLPELAGLGPAGFIAARISTRQGEERNACGGPDDVCGALVPHR